MGKKSGAVVVCALILSALTFAQGRGQLKGNPTPGTPQPEPPNLADRVTVTGCLGRIAPPTADPNAYGDNRFALTDVKKAERTMPGTATSAVATAPLAARYRLAAIDSMLTPFVDTRVELSGEIISPADGNGQALKVEFIQKTAAKCP
jgi:hypothetical protein